MRKFRGLKSAPTRTGILSLLAVCICQAASLSVLADVRSTKGYDFDVVNVPGMLFAGLARDGNALLVTELAGGKLYRLRPDRQLVEFGPVLPHGTDVIGDPTGPYQAVRHKMKYIVAKGWTPSGQDESPYDHALLEVDETKVIRVLQNDFLNPYDFTISGDKAYVIDAARNSLERVSMDSGAKQTVFVFPRLSQAEADLRRLSPTEFGGEGQYELDAVPTGIAAHGERIYVSLFGGFPFLAGSGRIVSLAKHEDSPSMRIEVEHLNSPVDVAFDQNEQMMVLEHGLYEQAEGFLPGTGRLLHVDLPTGRAQAIVEGLTRPVAVLAFDEKTIVISALDGTLTFLKRTAD
jgi:hypothetical protein